MERNDLDAAPAEPGIAFSLGITGHRPNRLTAEPAHYRGELARVLARISAIVSAIRGGGGFSDAAAQLRLVSALAEGADMLAAEAALETGLELDVLIPFARAEYLHDFAAPELRAQFSDLMNRAARVTELGGDRAAANTAYEAVGLATLAVSDVLIAVWDGKSAAGPGGTAEIVAEAVEAGVPVIHIPVDPALPIELVWTGLLAMPLVRPTLWTAPRATFDAQIERVLRAQLAPPNDPAEAEIRAALESRPPSLAFQHRAWPALLGLFRANHPAAPDAAEAELPPVCDAEFQHRIASDLEPLAQAADRAANSYGQKHRSGFVNNFALAAFAVMLAASAIVAEGVAIAVVPWLIGAEIVAIMLIIFNTWRGNRDAWHAKWLQMRHLAEWARVLTFALPLGDPLLRLDPGDTAPDDWIRWRIRAAARAIGAPARTINPASLGAMQTAVLALISDQLGYHHRTAARMKRMDHRTHRTGLVIFAVGIAVAIAHGWHSATHDPAHGPQASTVLPDLLTMFSVALPAFGSAIYGIRLQGNFAELAHRSNRMAAQLQRLHETVTVDPLRYELLADRIRQLAKVMLRDTEDWRLTFESRPLALPS